MSTSAVFDCMVFLQGAARPGGPARRCLDLVDAGEVTLFVSPAILAEVEDVLNRPKIRQRFPLLEQDSSRQLLRAVRTRAQLMTPAPSAFHYARDPKGEPYLRLAIAAKVPFLVTRDRDLLDLRRRDTAEGRDLIAKFPDLNIITPEEFLRRVKESSHAD